MRKDSILNTGLNPSGAEDTSRTPGTSTSKPSCAATMITSEVQNQSRNPLAGDRKELPPSPLRGTQEQCQEVAESQAGLFSGKYSSQGPNLSSGSKKLFPFAPVSSPWG